MTGDGKSLTTAEYAKKVGIPVAAVTRMLREGKLRGEKRGGRWIVFEDASPATPSADTGTDKSSSSPPVADTPMPPAGKTTYDVETFAELTYLTVKGVHQWLKAGRLSGRIAASGEIMIDAANLERPDFKHLVRK